MITEQKQNENTYSSKSINLISKYSQQLLGHKNSRKSLISKHYDIFEKESDPYSYIQAKSKSISGLNTNFSNKTRIKKNLFLSKKNKSLFSKKNQILNDKTCRKNIFYNQNLVQNSQNKKQININENFQINTKQNQNRFKINKNENINKKKQIIPKKNSDIMINKISNIKTNKIHFQNLYNKIKNEKS